MKLLRFSIFILCFLFFLASAMPEEAALSETITLPDVTTTIEGDSETVVSRALPDFVTLLPEGAPLLPSLPSLAIPEKAAENSATGIDQKKSEQRVFLEGTVGAGYSGFFTGDFKLFRPLGKLPFELAFLHETANGYARKSAAAGFYDNKTLLQGNVSYDSNESISLDASGYYESAAFGLQGQSQFFYNTTLQRAGADVDFRWKLPRDFYLAATADFTYLNRFCGYIAESAALINAAGIPSTLANFSLAPEIKTGWKKNGAHVYAQAGYTAFWSILQSTKIIHRGEFTLGTELEFETLPDFKTGANVSAAVSNAGNFTVPFTLFASAKIKPVQLYAAGGLRSSLTDIAALFAEQPFAGMIAVPVEQSDWFATLQVNVPVSMFKFDARIDFSKTAVGNKKILPDYGTFDAQSGFFPVTARERTELNTFLSAGLHKSVFGVILGYEAQWLDKNPLYYDQVITAQASVFSPKGTFAVTFDAEFGFSGDMMPVLGLSGYYRLSDSIQLSAELTDMIKLFSGTGRRFVAPFITRSGIAAVKITVLF